MKVFPFKVGVSARHPPTYHVKAGTWRKKQTRGGEKAESIRHHKTQRGPSHHFMCYFILFIWGFCFLPI